MQSSGGVVDQAIQCLSKQELPVLDTVAEKARGECVLVQQSSALERRRRRPLPAQVRTGNSDRPVAKNFLSSIEKAPGRCEGEASDGTASRSGRQVSGQQPTEFPRRLLRETTPVPAYEHDM